MAVAKVDSRLALMDDHSDSQFRVLLIEDDRSTSGGLSELLETAGYETCVVATFQEGLQALRDASPDLLIADVRLGRLDGLRLLAAAPNLPIIIMSGFNDRVLASEVRRLGAEHVLKPLNPPAFLELVRRCLSDRRDSNPSPARVAVN